METSGYSAQVRPQLLALQSVAAATEEAPSSAHRMLLLPSLGIAAVVLGSALLLSIVFALISTRTEPCRSYACGLFARNLQESMNRSFNPCYSFTRFVCDGWQQHHAHSVRTEIFMSALERLSRLTRNAVAGTTNDHRNGVARSGHMVSTNRERIAALYRSCDAVVRDGRNEMPYVKKALAQAGVFWPVRSRTPDVLRTVLYLSEVLHWPAIVSIHAKDDDGDSGSGDRANVDVWRTTVVVREAHTFPRMLGRQARLRTVNESRQFFDVLYAHFASDDGQDREGGRVTFRSDEGRRGRDAASAAQDLPGRDARRAEAARGRRREVRQPQRVDRGCGEALGRRWSPRHPHLVDEPGVLARFLELRRRHGEADMHLYVSWLAVRYAALFANMELVLNHYGADRGKALLNYGRACFAMTYTFVGDLVFALYDSDVVVRPNTNINVHSLVRDVRGAFVRRVSSSSRPSFASNTSFASRWYAVDSSLRLVDMPTDASAEDVALPSEVSDSLVTNWLAFWSLTRSPGYEAPRRSLSARPFQDCMFYTINETESDFVLSPFTLVLPFYDDGITAAVKYGGLGTQVGVASAELAFRFYRHLPDAEAALNESRSCLKFSSTSSGSPASPDLLMAEVASVEAVLDAFIRSGRGEDDRWLVTPQLSAVQVLLITWCFVKCPGREEPGVEGDPCSDVLRHVPRFSQAFDCSPETVLNPTHKCSVF
ncbi:hypothetical protein HPB50_019377 [Hyalomma asiaticum]|uniref:Uncharacterized protein n=1 Tax=Hyalomma asiaticum TaxID=266040 RepID=A0ACB7SGJ7_HYAAI|nr:hypothetical protein HPB50_019377 [Hyalomma asiaticum]